MTNYNHMAVTVVLLMILLTIITRHIIENSLPYIGCQLNFRYKLLKYVHIKQFQCQFIGHFIIIVV